MEIPFVRWFPVIATRRSRRKYDPAPPIPIETLDGLQKVCAEFKPFPDARAALITDHAEKAFKFILGSYGTIVGAKIAIAFIGNINNRHIPEEIGYFGEGIVLEAGALGLSTCWMTGTFSPKGIGELVTIKNDEKVFAVTPVGIPSESKSLTEGFLSGFGRSHQRKPLSAMFTGIAENEWPEWFKPALESARLAPSAMNRQPWHFILESHSITISAPKSKVDKYSSTRLDCGITMLHLEVAALNQGIKGRWELLEAPLVARFKF